jgi:hypothetical protein
MMQPTMVTLKQWVASLIVDFPTDNIPILLDEDKWKEWGNTLIQQSSFLINGAPSTNLYDDKFKWALDVFKCMSNFA